jgi:hypothetical protein
MRIWFIEPSEMSDQHLLGQHQEIHMLEGLIRSNGGWPIWRDKALWLVTFHARIVAEMDYRYDHLKRYEGVHPSPERFVEALAQFPQMENSELWKPTDFQIWKDQSDIRHRVGIRKTKWRWTRREKPEWLNSLL